MDAEFKSINKVVKSIMEEGKLKEYWSDDDEPITEIRCWFDPNEVFEDMYENNAIRVIAITLGSIAAPVYTSTHEASFMSGSESYVTITHQNLINAFDNKMLIVTFPKKSFLKIPEPIENQLAFLSISTAIKKSMFNRPFYPRHIETCSDPDFISIILEKRVVITPKVAKPIDKTRIF